MDYQKQVEEIIPTAKFGDLIEFAYPIGYSHWGVYDEDGYVIHFAVADEKQLKNNIRMYLQKIFPVCGDLLLGETRIRRVPLGEVNVPKGVTVSIGNDRHSVTPSASEDMRLRRDALLDRDFQYQLLSFNCEHFATFVRYGKAVCNQIPTRPKDKECEAATAFFKNVVSPEETVKEPFKETSDFFNSNRW
ncbi:phospholipase A and acyltransferase 4-like [Pseudoliparis swirei]|uniref:phospholipase A and acyltransferase 4-like n=1 Tax=Pseudoliparis swirei TaxID=2059687 RepID=UPI0024BE7747|nr:phospholipase A and acyltransferase 4-like [Pseudoliparis swirei]